MSDFTRRSFLGGTGVLPLALWLQLQGCGSGEVPEELPTDGPDVPDASRIRYDAYSAEGKAMLELYAKAVRKMLDPSATPEGDPRSWLFQWYTHAVRGDRTKAGEIARIYPAPSAWGDLAGLMWSTCQAHFPGAPEDYFLPWHRMFVYYFEAIVRQASGDDSFTLPYWNYSVAGPNHGVIPPEFRMQGDPVFGSLFVAKRSAGVNAGNPIDAGDPGALGLGSLAQCEYSSSPGLQGFNAALDFGLHGNVHVLTGNGQNMGSVPWAAGDPIFWLHHCNIDRLWASWNAAGRDNPTSPAWLDKTFSFADTGGNQVTAKIADFTSIAPLDYAYDSLEPVPVCPAAVIGAQQVPQVVTAARSTNIALGAQAVRFSLDPVSGDGGGIGVQATEDSRLYLVAKGLFTEVQPGVLYNVYLGLPEGASAEESKSYQVGTLNFFGAGGHGGHITAATVEEDKFVSFDVTELSQRLATEDPSGAVPALTIAPSGTPAAEAKPVVAEVSLVQR